MRRDVHGRRGCIKVSINVKRQEKKIIVMPKLRSWELQGSNTLKALLILGGAKVKIFHPPLHLDLSGFALKTCGSKGGKKKYH